ncbi:MAG: tripartite tricarboxylate transporter substrate binding protein [Thermodesulfobacteriota bacterium]|nr:tripartite tricarboxylate transporter substrate binding protein [Thermodesulfobacteriota bacterium]
MLRKMGVRQYHWILSSLTLLIALFVWSIDPGAARAAWPEKQVDLINPFGAGGAADVQARKLAEIISRDLGQPLVVRNVTGAGGAIAYNEVNRAKPDGHTLIWYSGAINTLAARKQISFDYQAFEPISGVGFETIAIAVNKTAPWKDFKEFTAFIKQNPGKVTMGNSGMGSVTHMVPVAMASKSGAQIVHVPFGTGLAVAALMGGKIDASSQHPAEILGQVKAGEVRVLAVSSEKRINLWPNVPTMKESGVDLAFDQWRGFAAPKGTPKIVIDKMSALVKKAVESKEWIEFAASLGTTPQYIDPVAFARFVAEMDKVTKEIVADAGLK